LNSQKNSQKICPFLTTLLNILNFKIWFHFADPPTIDVLKLLKTFVFLKILFHFCQRT
jgi:hypothetical protein